MYVRSGADLRMMKGYGLFLVCLNERDPFTCSLGKRLKTNGGPIKEVEAQKMAKRIGAVKHCACSAKTKVGLKELLEEVL